MKGQTKQLWASGGTAFAATALLVIGVFQLIVGIAAIGQDIVFITNSEYVYYMNMSAWGWIHTILGVLLILCGIGLFTRHPAAMMAGIVLAALSAIGNFFFLPFYPLWSLVIIAFDVFVIWSLGTMLSMQAAAAESEAMESETMAGGRRSDRDWTARDTEARAGTEPGSVREAMPGAATGRERESGRDWAARDAETRAGADREASAREAAARQREAEQRQPGRHRGSP